MSWMSRVPVLATILVVSGVLPAAPLHGEPPKRPNILLILSDTHRADYLGSAGFEGEISPNLDRLAESSAVFTRAVAPAPWTKPSIASLLTSLHPRTHRVVDHEGKFWRSVDDKVKSSALPDGAETLAEVLRDGGYRTGAWIANGWIIEGLGFAQGFEAFHSTSPNTNVYHAKKIWEPAWDWLRGLPADGRPFFLYLQFMDVHGPWRWSGEDYRALRGSPSLSKNTPAEELQKSHTPRMARDLDSPEFDRTLPSLRAVYASRVRSMDRQIGRLLEKLKSQGLMETTLILFTSDHGEELMDHGGWGHSVSLYAHQTHIPMIVRPPGGRRSARRIETAVSLIDIMPTLLTAAGAEHRPGGMQGTDLWDAVISDRPLEHPGWAFAGAVRKNPGIVSVQDSRYKLIRLPHLRPARHQLFDLLADPGERHNLAGEKPGQFQQLRAVLDEHLKRLAGAGSLLEAKGGLTPEELERLRSLGYVD